jgi:glycosyltransferase involved in cell wall biosynthesis
MIAAPHQMTPQHGRPRHVMMTTDTVGGVWVYAMALARQLLQAGMRVTLVTVGPRPQAGKYDAMQALPHGAEIVVTNLALEWLDPEGNDVTRARAELLRIADRVAPDIVHLNSFREGAFPWPCPAVVVAHSCVLSWWRAAHHDMPSEARWSLYGDAVAAGLNAADAWAAPSAAFRDTIAALYRPAVEGRVIHNGIDCFPETAAADKQPLILASGRVWDGGKNLAALAEIAADLPWPVAIAGPGMPESSEPGAQPVQWLGEIEHDDLLDRMQRAAIYAAPAHYEPFGLGILEAAAAGCALVLSDIASLRELWHGACLHVPAGDSERLRDALRQLCSDDALRLRLQREATIRARRYSIERTAAAYLALYRSVLAPADARGIAAAEEVRA